jgi:hypothetical protein
MVINYTVSSSFVNLLTVEVDDREQHGRKGRMNLDFGHCRSAVRPGGRLSITVRAPESSCVP